MFRNTTFLLAFLILITPIVTNGHGIGFTSLTTTTEEGYIIDLGYEEDTLREDTQTRLSFELYDNEATTTLSSFTEVWMVVKGPEGTVFSGGIDRPEFGETSISFTFPKAGEYEIQLRYQEDSRILARGNFDISVPVREDQQVNTTAYLASGGIMGLVLGVLSVLFFKRRRN